MTVGILIHSHASDHEKLIAYDSSSVKRADAFCVLVPVYYGTAGQCLRVQYILQYAYAQYIMPTRTVMHQTICLQYISAYNALQLGSYSAAPPQDQPVAEL